VLLFFQPQAQGGELMKLAPIRQFRSGISSYTRKGEMVIVTKNGRMVGCFLPLTGTEDIPIELKREFAATLGSQIAAQLSEKKVQEKEILDDFREFKKTRRRQ
jgi:antitoxin (DNA-binding transcriptional repressor) of toxin-antitoxin stability system